MPRWIEQYLQELYDRCDEEKPDDCPNVQEARALYKRFFNTEEPHKGYRRWYWAQELDKWVGEVLDECQYGITKEFREQYIRDCLDDGDSITDFIKEWFSSL